VDKLRVKFEPLWSPTAKEIAEERESVSRTDKNYIDSGVLTPEEVALSRFQRGGEWSREWTGVDRETREAMLQDILSNLQKGSEPGIPGADMGRTPGVQDVRGGAPGQDPGDVADVTDQQKKPAKTPGTTDETAKGDTIRKDYSPDQPRAENGQFGEGGGSTKTGIRTRAASGETFNRYSNKDDPMSDYGHAMFVKDEELTNYGTKQYGIKDGTPIVDVRDLAGKIEQAAEKYGLPEGYDTAADVSDQANPDDIVNTAKLWDDPAGLQWLAENVIEPNGIRAVETKNGLIAFYPEDIERTN
jgi:hypothetical protein